MTAEPLVVGVRDAPTVDAQRRLPEAELIQGVEIRELANVLMENGSLTEIFRDDWQPGTAARHVFQRLLPPGKVSACHAHAATVDRLFCGYGTVRITLYDGRADSPTHRRANVFRTGQERPQLITIPPGVWHAVVNIGATDALLVNAASQPYDHSRPDHWRPMPGAAKFPWSPRNTGRYGVDLEGFLRIFRAPSAGPPGPPCSFMPLGILGQNLEIPLGVVGRLGPVGLSQVPS